MSGGEAVRLLGVVGLYVAGVIGAGFASGQELTVFFVNYGRLGLGGLILAIMLLFLGVILILEHCSLYRTATYGDLFMSFGPTAARFYDGIYTFFLIVGSSVMLAGSAALGSTVLSQLFFRLVTAILVFLVLQGGVQGTLKSGTYLAPFIIALLLIIALWGKPTVLQYREPLNKTGALESGILYASYNLGFSVALLASIHHLLRTRREFWFGALLGNFFLGLCMFLLYLALSELSREQLAHPFPVLYLASNLGLAGKITYRIVLWVAMYSTALANSLALVNRFSHSKKLSWTAANALVCCCSFFFSHLGFKKLIEFAYPFLGLLGLWILANLLRLRWKKG